LKLNLFVLQTALGATKLKMLYHDFDEQLRAVDVSSKDKIQKLKKEMEARAAELLEAKKTIEGLDMQLRNSQ